MPPKKRKRTAKETPPKQSSKTTSNQHQTSSRQKLPAPANSLTNVPASRPIRRVLRDPQKPPPNQLLPRPPAV